MTMSISSSLHEKRLLPVVILIIPLLVSGNPLLVDVANEVAEASPLDEEIPPWWNGSYKFRIRTTIEPMDFVMENYPAEIDLNFTDAVERPDFELDPESIQIVEYSDDTGTASPVRRGRYSDVPLSIGIPHLFHPIQDYHAGMNAMGTLTWLLDGRTEGSRFYHIYFNGLDVEGDGSATNQGYSYTEPLLESHYWVGRGHTLYGFNPGEQGDWSDVDKVEVVGLHDGTVIRIVNITDPTTPETFATGDLDEGGLLRTSIPDGTYFKVMASRPVVSSVSSAVNDGGSAKTFYPSSDGGLVGSEFTFMAYSRTGWDENRHGINIYSVESGDIRIENRYGEPLSSFFLDSGQYRVLDQLKGGVVYRITSSGLIMIEQEAINAFTILPSITGSPVGKEFYGSTQSFDTEALLVTAHENATVVLEDMDTGEGFMEMELEAGQRTYRVSLGDRTMHIRSSGNVSVMLGSTEGGEGLENLGDDIAFSGGVAGRVIDTYSIGNPGPGGKDRQYPCAPAPGILFAFKNDTTLLIDGKTHHLSMDEHLDLTDGPHQISSDRPVSVMTLGRGFQKQAEHRWNDWGSYLSGGLTSPHVETSPVEEFLLGIDLEPHPSEGTVNNTMFHPLEAGESTTFVISVRNTGTVREEMKITLSDVPAGWTAGPDPEFLDLVPGEGSIVQVRVDPPISVEGGQRINISIAGTVIINDEVTDSVYAEILVDPHRSPDLFGETEKLVKPGETAFFALGLENSGNVLDRFHLEHCGSVPEDWTVTLEPDRVDLSPGENTSIRLEVTPPEKEPAWKHLVLDIKARTDDDPTIYDIHRTRTVVDQVFNFSVIPPPVLEIFPGETRSAGISLKNLGNGVDTFALSHGSPPSGWKIGSPEPMTLGPGNKGNLSLELTVPPNDGNVSPSSTEPGDRRISMLIMDTSGQKSRVNLTVRVLQIYGITLRVDPDHMVGEGDRDVTFHIEVVNTGSGNDTITLASDGGSVLGTERVSLEAGEVEIVNCTIPPKMWRWGLKTYDVVAVSSGGAETNRTLTVESHRPRTFSALEGLPCMWIVVAIIVLACAFTATAHLLRKRKEKEHPVDGIDRTHLSACRGKTEGYPDD